MSQPHNHEHSASTLSHFARHSAIHQRTTTDKKQAGTVCLHPSGAGEGGAWVSMWGMRTMMCMMVDADGGTTNCNGVITCTVCRCRPSVHTHARLGSCGAECAVHSGRSERSSLSGSLDRGGLATLLRRRLGRVKVELVGSRRVGGRLDVLRVVREVGAQEDASLTGEEDAVHEHRARDDHNAEPDEATVERLVLARADDELPPDDRAQVAAGAHHAGDHAEGGARDEGHDAKVEALSHLDEEREDDDQDHRDAERVAIVDAVGVGILHRDLALDRQPAHGHRVERADHPFGCHQVVGAALIHMASVVVGPGAVDQHLLGTNADHGAARVGAVDVVIDGVQARGVGPHAGHFRGAVKLGGVGAVHVHRDNTQEDAHHALERLDYPHAGDAPTDAILDCEPVGEDATPRARKEVHQREAGAKRRRRARRLGVVAVEEQGELVVHGELNAEAQAVCEHHDQRIGVGEADHGEGEAARRAALGRLLLGAGRFELRVGAVGEVAASHDEAGGEQVHHERNDDAHAPRPVDGLAHLNGIV
mmetsp:Transcript_226/g.669  ORF Transcript_226/g.669 Transcript_226/m.669 type:complete len:535 (-) Transcript_226:734-2338(-)